MGYSFWPTLNSGHADQSVSHKTSAVNKLNKVSK